MEEKQSGLKVFINGMIKENPVFVLMIGMCPSLAITTAAGNGLGMGLATMVVLLGSNVVISLLRRFIPGQVRLPAFITVIAGFVTVLGFAVERFFPALNTSLGLYLPLIIVNCIILMRAETFACRNAVFRSALDGLGVGAGFTGALFILSSIREILGSGTWFDIRIIPERYVIPFFTDFGGAFFVLGILLAIVNVLTKKRGAKEKTSCAGCPNAESCGEA